MSDEVVVVRNLTTGLEHTVTAGHWATDDPGYELVESPKKQKRTTSAVSKKAAEKKKDE